MILEYTNMCTLQIVYLQRKFNFREATIMEAMIFVATRLLLRSLVIVLLADFRRCRCPNSDLWECNDGFHSQRVVVMTLPFVASR
jgi:hypothetical protein